MRRASFLLAVLVGFSPGIPGEARANFVTIVGSSDANLTAPTTPGSFTGLNTFAPSNFGLVITQLAGLNASTVETRSVIEFNLAALGQGATIQSVTFNFQESSFTSDSGQSVGIFGYKGTGSIGLSDATASATQLGSYNPTAVGLATDLVTLTGPALQTLLGSSGFLALRLQGINSFENTSINSLEEAAQSPQFDTAPSISVTFTPAAVPEPSSLVLLGGGMITVVGAVVARRRRATA